MEQAVAKQPRNVPYKVYEGSITHIIITMRTFAAVTILAMAATSATAFVPASTPFGVSRTRYERSNDNSMTQSRDDRGTTDMDAPPDASSHRM
eukprot:scaffold64039_cov50-Attheya_sp.AAC.1